MDDYEIEERRLGGMNPGDGNTDYSVDKFASKLFSGIAMKDSPFFMSKDEEIHNLMMYHLASRGFSKRQGGIGAGFGFSS
jgi:hypothetical protein